MVARSSGREATEEQRAGFLARLFDTWRLMLASGARGLLTGGRVVATAVGAAFVSATRLVRDRAASVPTSHAVAVGVGSLLTGTLAGVLVSRSSGESLVQAGLLATIATLWPLARLAVLRILSNHCGISKTDATRAWGAGTLPYVFAATPALRTAAWVLGGIAGFRVLRELGAPATHALRLIAWAWGLEVAGALLMWATRGIPVVLLGG